MTLKEESDKMELKFFPFYDSLYDIRYEMNGGDIWLPDWFNVYLNLYRSFEFEMNKVSFQTKTILDIINNESE